MAESQFLPSTTYGLDPVSLASKVAQTNATIAGTQSTRQSMMQRAQQMKLEQEQGQRAQQLFNQQQSEHQLLWPAIEATSRADKATALATIQSTADHQNDTTEFQTLRPALEQEIASALTVPQTDDGNGGTKSDYSTAMQNVSGVIAKLARFHEVKGSAGYAEALNNAYNGFKQEQLKEMDRQRLAMMQTEMTNRMLAIQGMKNTGAGERNATTNDTKKQIAGMQVDAKGNPRPISDYQLIKAGQELTKLKLLVGDNPSPEAKEELDAQEAAINNGWAAFKTQQQKQAGGGNAITPSANAKPNVRQNGVEFQWNGTEYTPVQ